jgi:hypothetical protein
VTGGYRSNPGEGKPGGLLRSVPCQGGDSGLPPFGVGWPRPLAAEVVNGEGVVPVEHLQAGSALVGDHLRVLGAQAQGDAAAT